MTQNEPETSPTLADAVQHMPLTAEFTASDRSNVIRYIGTLSALTVAGYKPHEGVIVLRNALNATMPPRKLVTGAALVLPMQHDRLGPIMIDVIRRAKFWLACSSHPRRIMSGDRRVDSVYDIIQARVELEQDGAPTVS
jgi:hypothetical protein